MSGIQPDSDATRVTPPARAPSPPGDQAPTESPIVILGWRKTVQRARTVVNLALIAVIVIAVLNAKLVPGLIDSIGLLWWPIVGVVVGLFWVGLLAHEPNLVGQA